MLLAAVVLCAWAGLAAFAFAMDRHHARVHGSKILCRQRVALRASGFALLALALAAAIVRDGVSFGILLWVALLGLVAMALALLLAYRPRIAFTCSPAAWVGRFCGRSDRTSR